MRKFFGNFILQCYCKLVRKWILLFFKKNNKLASKLCIYLSVYNGGVNIYLKEQLNVSNRCFIQVLVFFFSSAISSRLLKCLFFYSSRKKKIFGFFLHTPVGGKLFSSFSIYSTIISDKDLDGISFKNQFTNFFLKPSIFSCTARGVLKILKLKIRSLRGLHIVIISTSNIIGVPLIREFLREGAFISVFKEISSKLCQQILLADIVISAFPRFTLFGNCFLYKKQLILVDVAIIIKKDQINGNFSLCTNFLKRGIYLTAVPGGVGPFTISYFLLNTLVLFFKINFL